MENPRKLPFVSVVMPMLNEEKFIEQCLASLLADVYPRKLTEIIIVDGMSQDASRDIVARYIKKYPFIKMLDNPGRIASKAMNVGIRAALGEIIVRVDAHTVYEPDYISNCVNLLMDTEAVNVGGVQKPVGTDYITDAIAIATSTPFGVGDAKFRYADQACWVDTVYLGAWWKKNLLDIGLYNEDWVINEDYELNYRLRQAGGKILLSPLVKCQYYVRGSLKKLAVQYFRYGKWKVKTLAAHPGSLRWRQMAPPVLVAGIIASLIMLMAGSPLGFIIPVLYLLASAGVAAALSGQKGWRYFPILPIVFGLLHFSWGIGFYSGIYPFLIQRK
jgi:glycosyltransferase involved in cell wall biosynthesis